MRVRNHVFVLGLSLVLGLASAPAAEAGVRAGDRAADFVSVKDARGKKLRLKQFRGRVVILTFGASWCKPCNRELPAYETLSKSYDRKDVVFIAVNIDSELAAGRKFIQKAGLKNVIAGYDPGKSSVESWEPPTMPTTFVIDRKGIVRHVHRGYEGGDEKKLARVIDKLR